MPVKDYYQASLDLHRKFKGKIGVHAKMPVKSKDELATGYSTGVAAPCEAIAKDPEAAYLYTIKSNTVAVISDGSAVLG